METTDQNYNTIMDNVATELPTLLPNADNAQTLLNDITTTSKVAEHRLFAYVIAFCHTTIQNLFTKLVSIVNALLEAKEPGVDLWYNKIMLEFQFNYQLYWTGKKYEYNDTTSALAVASKVIKYVSTDGRNGRVIVKVAGETGGVPTQLTAPQIAAATAYLAKRKYSGTKELLVALPPDFIKTVGTIYFDALLTQPTVQASVEAAIIQFYKLIPFNGKLNVNELLLNIKQVPGVKDFVISNVFYRYGSNPFVAIVREWQAHAGYVIADNTSGNTLTDTITYIAQ